MGIDKGLGFTTRPVGLDRIINPAELSNIGKLLVRGTVQAGGSAVVSTAIRGGKLSDNFQAALVGQAMDMVGAAVFNWVGDITAGRMADGSVQKVAVHALVGGLLNEAAGGDFATGAIAAGASEALVKQLAGLEFIQGENKEQLLLAISQSVGIVAAGLAGKEELQEAAWISKTATANNWLRHGEIEEANKKLAACGASAAAQGCRDAIIRETDALDKRRNQELNDHILRMQSLAAQNGWSEE